MSRNSAGCVTWRMSRTPGDAPEGETQMKPWKLLVVGSACVALVSTALAIDFAGADTAASTLVAMTPCRLLDTRADTHVGDKSSAFTPGETATLSVVGSHGQCTIPAGTTAISANITI